MVEPRTKEPQHLLPMLPLPLTMRRPAARMQAAPRQKKPPRSNHPAARRESTCSGSNAVEAAPHGPCWSALLCGFVTDALR